ncbi:hypothetical protein [Pseudomonas tolaasii]|uniref:hypothetical protein n=1 Tax=Pseudomonas tolaasii TaxID=29442 RepID=UPI0012FD3F39|nr:hypothetical protein [Pseudomonas tolaasii]
MNESWADFSPIKGVSSKRKGSLVVSGISFGEKPSFYGGDEERNAELSSFQSKGTVPQIDQVRIK